MNHFHINPLLFNQDGNFKEEASIVLKKQNNVPVSNTCPAKKPQLNGTNGTLNGNDKTNGTANDKLNGHSKVSNSVDSKNLNGHSQKTAVDSVKVDTTKAQKKFSQVRYEMRFILTFIKFCSLSLSLSLLIQDLNEEDNCPICDKSV